MRKKALITGITGFVGPHLAHFLSCQGNVEILGTYLMPEQLHAVESIKSHAKLYQMDLSDPQSVNTLIAQTQPDYIFHLAAQSNVALSWKEPAQTFDVNVLGTIHLLEAIRNASLDPVIQIACSSEQYGLVPEEHLPVTEETPFHPLSPYAVSRVTIDLMGYQYFKSYGMRIIRTRAFNHTGPGQNDQFVCSRFAKTVAEIEKGMRKPILTVGNLDAIRDFTDVRDMVRAYALSVMHGTPGEAYVIASGIGRSIKKVVDILLSLSHEPIRVEKDPALLRPSDVPVLFGDSSKFREATEWQPQITFEQTLEDLLEYWRARVMLC